MVKSFKDKKMVVETKKADKATIIVHSGDMDKIYSASYSCKSRTVSMGMEASLYFTFWGLQRLQKGGLEEGLAIEDALPGTWKVGDQKKNETNQCCFP